MAATAPSSQGPHSSHLRTARRQSVRDAVIGEAVGTKVAGTPVQNGNGKRMVTTVPGKSPSASSVITTEEVFFFFAEQLIWSII